MLYQAYEAQRGAMAPARAAAATTLRLIEHLPASVGASPAGRLATAAQELVLRAALTHTRPPFGIDRVVVGNHDVAVHEEVVESTPFCTLLRFRREDERPRPRVLLVAALAGHFSTLLRPTVATLVRDHDVYVTDWHNARDVPVRQGSFGFDDFVGHLVRFLRRVGPGAHVFAVCQPCPATLAATALMAEDGDPALPRTMTLMAGPVDTRVNPTQVNRLATELPLSWFERHVIHTVPWRYEGAGRRVYPGFLQLTAFMSMNWQRHLGQELSLFRAMADGDRARADAIATFYDEYLAVLDMPAEFYLQTLDEVFQRHLLPTGGLEVGGRPVHPEAITRTALLTVEGGRDDICGLGQTMAAHAICVGIPPSRREHHLQPGAGHYGVFAGHAWERQIYPVLREFIRLND